MNTTVEFPPSLWADVTPHRALESTFTGIAETDVAIIGAGFTGRPAVSDTRGDLRFFRYDARNRLITGGAVMGKYEVENRVASKAAKNLAEAFPELGTPNMTHLWSGYIGMNRDRFPRVHRLGPDGYTWLKRKDSVEPKP